MNANPTLLRMKSGRIVERFSELADMHCLSDYYLADELIIEYKKRENIKSDN